MCISHAQTYHDVCLRVETVNVCRVSYAKRYIIWTLFLKKRISKENECEMNVSHAAAQHNRKKLKIKCAEVHALSVVLLDELFAKYLRHVSACCECVYAYETKGLLQISSQLCLCIQRFFRIFFLFSSKKTFGFFFLHSFLFIHLLSSTSFGTRQIGI